MFTYAQKSLIKKITVKSNHDSLGNKNYTINTVAFIGEL